MYCTECGQQLPNAAKFCSACGAPVALTNGNPANTLTGQLAGNDVAREVLKYAEAGDTEAMFEFASWCKEQGHAKDAEYWFVKLFETGDYFAAYELGKLFAHVDDVQAEKWFLSATEEMSEPYLAEELGNLYLRKGMRSEAKAWFERAVGLLDGPGGDDYTPEEAAAIRRSLARLDEEATTGSGHNNQTLPNSKGIGQDQASESDSGLLPVRQWVQSHGIHKLVWDDQGNGMAPDEVKAWDKNRTWTFWDGFDETGGFVEPGLDEGSRGDYFISGWFLGVEPFDPEHDMLTILEREACEACETDGCDSCESLGWLETELLDEFSHQIEGL